MLKDTTRIQSPNPKMWKILETAHYPSLTNKRVKIHESNAMYTLSLLIQTHQLKHN